MKHTRLVVRLTGLGEAQAEGVVAVLALFLLVLAPQCWRIGHEEKDTWTLIRRSDPISRPSSPVRRIRLPLTKPLDSSLRCP